MYQVIEPAIDITPVFSITWETTLKCNLDCSYCVSHDNTIPHPSMDDCFKTIDFLYEYVDTYLSSKNQKHQHVSFNIFGGESLAHPHIVEILDYAYHTHKNKYSWSLGINTVTNGIVKPKVWEKLIDYFDFLTVSHHSEVTPEEKDLFRRNILFLKEKGKNFQVSVLYNYERIKDCLDTIEWCKSNNVKYWARQLDGIKKSIKEQPITFVKKHDMPAKLGRSCCGGQKFNVNYDYDKEVSYIHDNNFSEWYCSVNQFFVFVKQVTREVFVNKDCRMAYDGIYGPIGTLDNARQIIENAKERVSSGKDYIVCKKDRCWCGLCAPKAKDKDAFDEILKRYRD